MNTNRQPPDGSTNYAYAGRIGNQPNIRRCGETATGEQLLGSLRAMELSVAEETLQRLDTIWRGSGGEAPDAYSW